MSFTKKTYKKISVIKLSADFSEATKIIEVRLTQPSDDQILVRNYYCGVNATDINITAGRHFTDGKLPFDIGLEGLGIIEEVGNNVTLLKRGQIGLHYKTSNLNSRAYAEYSYINPEDFIPLPDDRPEFISLLISGLTASIGLEQAGRIKKGEKILITAAAGGTGHIGVQLAKLKGCFVIGLCSSKKKEKVLYDLGCDRVINYKEEILDQVLSREFSEGIDVIWESIGGTVFETLFNHLKIRGRLVTIGGTVGYKTVGVPDVKIPELPTKILFKSLSLTGFALPTYDNLHKQHLKQLIDLFINNKLKIILDFGEQSSDGCFQGIDSIVRAVEYLHSGLSIGKVVVNLRK